MPENRGPLYDTKIFSPFVPTKAITTMKGTTDRAELAEEHAHSTQDRQLIKVQSVLETARQQKAKTTQIQSEHPAYREEDDDVDPAA